jgi:hypothetical protein
MIYTWFLVAWIGSGRATLGEFKSAAACEKARSAMVTDDPHWLGTRSGVCVRVLAEGRVRP